MLADHDATDRRRQQVVRQRLIVEGCLPRGSLGRCRRPGSPDKLRMADAGRRVISGEFSIDRVIAYLIHDDESLKHGPTQFVIDDETGQLRFTAVERVDPTQVGRVGRRGDIPAGERQLMVATSGGIFHQAAKFGSERELVPISILV